MLGNGDLKMIFQQDIRYYSRWIRSILMGIAGSLYEFDGITILRISVWEYRMTYRISLTARSDVTRFHWDTSGCGDNQELWDICWEIQWVIMGIYIYIEWGIPTLQVSSMDKGQIGSWKTTFRPRNTADCQGLCHLEGWFYAIPNDAEEK